MLLFLELTHNSFNSEDIGQANQSLTLNQYTLEIIISAKMIYSPLLINIVIPLKTGTLVFAIC